MAQVLPAESDLRRVIGDGADVADREVDGLDEKALLDLYRSLVLLRTYDERSVVYHRQGRVGTYAMFWNHEAMQVGSVHALSDDDWIFASYRESAIGLLRGMAPSTAPESRFATTVGTDGMKRNVSVSIFGRPLKYPS